VVFGAGSSVEDVAGGLGAGKNVGDIVDPGKDVGDVVDTGKNVGDVVDAGFVGVAPEGNGATVYLLLMTMSSVESFAAAPAPPRLALLGSAHMSAKSCRLVWGPFLSPMLVRCSPRTRALVLTSASTNIDRCR
jgi:hypothetical protein